MEWLTEHKIPLGRWIKELVDILNQHAAWLFNAFADGVGTVIDGLIDLLQWCPPLLLIALFALIGHLLQRSWKLTLLIVVALLLVINLGYWEDTMETLALVVFAASVCMVIGVPLGIAAAHRPWLYTLLRPILDLMQTIPTFVYLIPTLILFGLGVVPGLISTVIFAIPAPIRLTHLGITSVPTPLLEAGEAFGATGWQRLWKVELPHAMPTIMAGLTQCIMLSLSMVVIAALVGAGGLGKPVVRALNTVNIAQGFEAGLAIVLVAILLDRVCRRANPGQNPGQGGR
jgi:glycine betaine/proline transport system permease protein